MIFKSVETSTPFKNLEEKFKRESLKRTISASGGNSKEKASFGKIRKGKPEKNYMLGENPKRKA